MVSGQVYPEKTKNVILNKDGTSSAFILNELAFKQHSDIRCGNRRSMPIHKAELL